MGLPHSMGFQHRFGSLFGQLKDYSKPSLVRCPTFKGPGSSSSNGTREVVNDFTNILAAPSTYEFWLQLCWVLYKGALHVFIS